MPMSSKPQGKSVTIADVAEQAGVSTATVSRVLNGSGRVNPATAKRVRDAIERLGYFPQAAARNLARRKTNTLGVMLREIGNDFAAQMLRGIEASTSRSNYDLLIASNHNDEHNTRNQLPLGPHNTDGLIVLTGCLSQENISRLHFAGFPLVLLYENPPDQLPIPSIHIENRQGTCQLIDHLIEIHGYEQIAFLRGPENNQDSELREAGLRDSLAAHGLSLNPDLIGEGLYNEEPAQRIVQTWVKEGKKPDAIFGGSDEGAIGAVMGLKSLGIHVPEEIAVVGFDDLTHARLLSPPLTTVHAPTEKVSMLAVETLINLLQGDVVDQTICLPTELVIRRSCGCSQP
jgi:DNA-binding LacI/PurR family transcriptional regulator